MKILVTTFGNIFGYKEVTYVYGNKILKNKSSLALLYQEIQPDYVFIIVLDTLASIESEKDHGFKYNNIISEIQKVTESFLEENCILNGEKNYQVIVSPGVGSFKNGTFKGNMKDFYVITLYELINKLSELKRLPSEENIEIHLDISQGINFMPTLTYKAVHQIARILALRNPIAKERNVTVFVYNADPVIPTERSNSISKINLIETIRALPMPDVRPLEGKQNYRIISYFEMGNSEKGKIGRMLYKKIGDFEISPQNINVFISSVFFGFPLMTFTFYPNVKSLKLFIQEILRMYQDYSVLKEKQLIHHVSLDEGLITLLKTYLMASVLNLERKEEVSINDLKALANTLFNKEPTKTYIENDLEDLRKIVDSFINSKYFIEKQWFLVADIIDKLNLKKVSGSDLRSFIAHSGLTYRTIDIKVSEGETFFRYNKDPENLNLVKTYANSLLVNTYLHK